jgi:hypothetical protein
MLLSGHSFSGPRDCMVQFLFQKSLWWQFGQLAGDSDTAVFQPQQFDVVF